MYHIYLAGPITGCRHSEAVGWRERFTRLMNRHLSSFDSILTRRDVSDVNVLSPMRGKEHLAQLNKAITGAYPDSLTNNQRAIMHRDHRDVCIANLVVMNLLASEAGGGKPSLGTVMEAAWCYDHHIPLIAIMDPPDSGISLYEHPMLLECVSNRVTSVEQAFEIAKLVLNV